MNFINNEENEDFTWNNGLSSESKAALEGKDKENLEVEKKWMEIQRDYLKRYPLLRPQDVKYQPKEFIMLLDQIAKRTMRTRHDVKVEIENWQPSLYTRYDR